MSRFDLSNNPSSRSRAASPFLLDVQSDHLCNLMSRVVGNYTVRKVAQDLSPINEIEGGQFVLETPLLACSGQLVPAPRLARSKLNKTGSLPRSTVCSALTDPT
jgi:toxin CcdB